MEGGIEEWKKKTDVFTEAEEGGRAQVSRLSQIVQVSLTPFASTANCCVCL